MGLKGVGCGIGILGAIAVIVGCTLFGLTFRRALEANVAVERELAFASEQVVEVTVSTDRLCQVAVRVTVEVPPGTVRGRSGGGFSVPYEFPVRYAVSDAAGRTLVEETTVASWQRGNRTVTQDTASAEGGTFVAEHGFIKFPPPADGLLRVRCTIDADTQGLAARQPQVVVYDRVSEQARTVSGAFAALALGGLFGVVGIVLFVVGFAAAKRQAAEAR